MADYCAFCGKKIGFSEMPIGVTKGRKEVMCRACNQKYKVPFYDTIKTENQAKIEAKVKEIKEKTGNDSQEFDSLLAAFKQELEERWKKERAEEPEGILRAQLQEKEAERLKAEFARIREFPATTEDIDCKYKIIAPVIFNTTNKGVFTSVYNKLSAKYSRFPHDILLVKPANESLAGSEWGMTLLSLMDISPQFEGTVGQASFDRAFYIGVAELKLRAAEIGANAIVGIRMDFDLDTTNFGAFYLQIYGTAVRIEE